MDFGLTSEQKELIFTFYSTGVTTPNNILIAFRKSKVPEDPDKPFVVDYAVGDPDDVDVELRVFISTTRLLRFATFFKHFHADATYKLVHQGYPILVAGVTDMAKTFYPCGIAVCKSEFADDYEFLFKGLKKGVKMISKEEYSPAYLIADCADPIDGAVLSAKQINRLMKPERINQWKSFNAYVDEELYIYRVECADECITDFTCTCVHLMKNYTCEHVVGIAVLLDKFDIPLEAKTGRLGARRGPGRPKKCSRTLDKE